MAVVQVGTATTVSRDDQGSGSASMSIDKPTGVQAGDLLVAFIQHGLDGIASSPSGWILENSTTSGGTLNFFWKIADGSEPSSYTWTFTTFFAFQAGTVFAFRGVNPDNPINAYQVDTSTAGSATTTTPSVTATAAPTRSLHVRYVRRNSSTEPTLSTNADVNEVTSMTSGPSGGSKYVTHVWSNSSQHTTTGSKSGISSTASPSTLLTNDIRYHILLEAAAEPESAAFFVGSGASYSGTNNSSTINLNAPTGLADGDLLIGVVAARTTSTTNINPPSGWTLKRRITGGVSTVFVLMREASASDSGESFNATLSSSSNRRHARVVAYRGMLPPASQLPAYLNVPGVGDQSTSPDHSSLDITGDIDLRADITPASWTPASEQAVVAKYVHTDNQRSYQLAITPNQQIEIAWSTNGAGGGSTQLRQSTATVTPGPDGRLAIRAALDVSFAGQHRVFFYTAPTIDGPWTQLGSTVQQSGTTSIFSSSAPMELGASNAGNTRNFAGKIHAVEVRSGINGTVVANPRFIDANPGDTSVTDETGKTWTLQGNSSIVGEEDASNFSSTDTDEHTTPTIPNLNIEQWRLGIVHCEDNAASIGPNPRWQNPTPADALRFNTHTGTSTNCITTALFDSDGPIGLGNTNLFAEWNSDGAATSFNESMGWIGLLEADPTFEPAKQASAAVAVELGTDAGAEKAGGSAGDLDLALAVASETTGKTSTATGAVDLDLATAATAAKTTAVDGAVDLALGVAGDVQKQGHAGADLGLTITTEDAATEKAGEASGAVDVDLGAAGSTSKAGEATGVLDVGVTAAAVPEKSVDAATSIDVSLGVGGSAAKAVGVAADLDLTTETEAAVEKAGAAAADLDVAVEVEATSSGIPSAAGELDLDVAVAAEGAKHAQADAEMSLATGIAGETAKAADTAATLPVELGADATAAKNAAATAGVALDLTLGVTPTDKASSTTAGLDLVLLVGASQTSPAGTLTISLTDATVGHIPTSLGKVSRPTPGQMAISNKVLVSTAGAPALNPNVAIQLFEPTTLGVQQIAPESLGLKDVPVSADFGNKDTALGVKQDELTLGI